MTTRKRGKSVENFTSGSNRLVWERLLTQISSWLSSKLLSISFDASLKNAKVIVRIGYGDPKMSIKMLNISPPQT